MKHPILTLLALGFIGHQAFNITAHWRHPTGAVRKVTMTELIRDGDPVNEVERDRKYDGVTLQFRGEIEEVYKTILGPTVVFRVVQPGLDGRIEAGLADADDAVGLKLWDTIALNCEWGGSESFLGTTVWLEHCTIPDAES